MSFLLNPYTFSAGGPTDYVALYNFEDNLNDSSGNGHNATPTAVTYSDVGGISGLGKYGIFNGSTSKGVIAENAVFQSTTFSIMGWVKTSDTSPVRIFSCSVINSLDYSGWDLFLLNGYARLEICTNNGSEDITSIDSTTYIGDGGWKFITAKHSGSSINIYVNGYIDATPVASAVPSFDTLNYPTIGAGYGNGAYGNFITGDLDRMKYFIRDVNDSEVLATYNQEKP